MSRVWSTTTVSLSFSKLHTSKIFMFFLQYVHANDILGYPKNPNPNYFQVNVFAYVYSGYNSLKMLFHTPCR